MGEVKEGGEKDRADGATRRDLLKVRSESWGSRDPAREADAGEREVEGNPSCQLRTNRFIQDIILLLLKTIMNLSG